MQISLPTHKEAPGLYAGFWKRAVAYVIDNIILLLGTIVLFLIGYGLFRLFSQADTIPWPGGWAMLIFLGLNLLYKPLFEGSGMQSTPGKSLIGARVTELNGDRVSHLSAFKRHLGRLINISTAFLLYFGYWMAGINSRKQAAHDYISDTLVINAEVSLDEYALKQRPMMLGESGGITRDAIARAALVAVPLIVGAVVVLPMASYMGSPQSEAHDAVAELEPILNDVVLEHALSVGALPASAEELGNQWPEFLNDGTATPSIIDGNVVIEFLADAHPDLAGKTIGFSVFETETHYLWACGYHSIPGRLISALQPSELTSLPREHTPGICREDPK